MAPRSNCCALKSRNTRPFVGSKLDSAQVKIDSNLSRRTYAFARSCGRSVRATSGTFLSYRTMSTTDPDPILVETESHPMGRTVSETRSEYYEVCLPNDANTLGNMLGGHMMHLVDLCGAIAAIRHSRSAVVTASVDQMTFLHPVRIGELVKLKSQVNRVFRTSMEVGVKVWVENMQTGEQRHTSSAYLTFVALDRAGNRVVLPPILPETEEEKRRFEEAAERRAYRLAFKDKTKSSPNS